MERCVPLCSTVCVFHSFHCQLQALVEYVHVFMSIWPSLSTPSPMHSYMGSSLCHCVCCSHLISVLTPCLEYVHVSVHVYMPTWVLNTAPYPMHSNMDVTVWHCVLCSHPTSVPRPWSECVHTSVYGLLSTWLPMSASPNCILTWIDGFLCVCLSVIYFWSHILFKMCTCISTLIYVLTWLPTFAPPHLKSFMKT